MIEAKKRFMDGIISATKDPVFNLVVGKSPSPGNKAAKLAEHIISSTEVYDNVIDIFSGIMASWLLPVLNIDNITSASRDKQCRLFFCTSIKEDNRKAWKKFLTDLNIGDQGSSDLLFQFVMSKNSHFSLQWKSFVLLKKADINAASLSLTPEEEKVLRYVAGFIPFSLKKKYYSRRDTNVGRVVLDLVSSWTSSDLKDSRGESVSTLYEYSLSWTEKINRGGLMVVNEIFFVFIRRVESVARTIINRDLMINYKGEDLRDIILNKFLKSAFIDQSWCAMVRHVDCQELKNILKMAILKKWINIRVRSFVNAWLQIVKRRSNITGKKISDKSEPSLRKTLHVSRPKKD